MTRRWAVGDYKVNGLQFRIVPGRKKTQDGEPGLDLRLDVLTRQGWEPVHMSLGAFLADFFCENEDILYPYGQGGQKYLSYQRVAWKSGWREAERWLQYERAQRSLFDEDDESAAI